MVYTFLDFLGNFGRIQDFGCFKDGWGGKWGLGVKFRNLNCVYTSTNPLSLSKIALLEVGPTFALLSCAFQRAASQNAHGSIVNLETTLNKEF